MNGRINATIETYLGSQSKTDYAIMINGQWGCGKTYYVENELKNLIENKGMKYIYVSLNGCDNFSKIINKITFKLFIKKDSAVDDDLMFNFFNLGADLAKMNSSVDIVYKSIVQLKNMATNFITNKTSMFDISKIIIIFDDIERISDMIHISDILGTVSK